MLKVELGGGWRPRGEGWVNVDKDPKADIVTDLERRPWPLEDDSVDELYSCHCLEHIAAFAGALNEIARICKLNAPVELRLPYPHSELALVEDHKHVFGPVAAINIDEHFPQLSWHGPKRLKLERMELFPTFMLERAKRELPFLAGLSDEVIMRWIPGTCHETRFFYRVANNEFYKGEA